MLYYSVFTELVIFWNCVITQGTLNFLRTLYSWMFSILMRPEATSSQVGEVTELAEFPWSFLPSLLSELVHYRHLVLSARVVRFVTITQVGFMRHTFRHSKSILVGACVITWVVFQRCFLQLFVISIKVLSQSTLFGTYRLASVTFLLSLVLRQSLLCGSSVYLLEHLYSHSSHWNSQYICFFWWTFMFSEHMYNQIYLFSVFVFTLGALILILSLNIHLHMVLLQGINRQQR